MNIFGLSGCLCVSKKTFKRLNRSRKIVLSNLHINPRKGLLIVIIEHFAKKKLQSFYKIFMEIQTFICSMLQCIKCCNVAMYKMLQCINVAMYKMLKCCNV